MLERLSRLARTVKRRARYYAAIGRDPRTPRLSRWLIAGALAYLLSPIDLVPDFIPVLGHLDDALVVPFMVALALALVPAEVLADHKHLLETET